MEAADPFHSIHAEDRCILQQVKCWRRRGAGQKGTQSVISLPESFNGLSPSLLGSAGFEDSAAFAPFPFAMQGSRNCLRQTNKLE